MTPFRSDSWALVFISCMHVTRCWSNLIGAGNWWLLCDSLRHFIPYIRLAVTDSITRVVYAVVKNKLRCDKPCNNLYTSGGHLIPWVDEMRYLGLFIVQSHIFRCSLDHAKRSFYRTVNGIFGKIGRTASEEVVLELVKTKCLPILQYGLEACPLNKTNLRSLDFSVNRFFMKLFKTSDNSTPAQKSNWHLVLGLLVI